jgi:pimeloyl-ACP methyl ester carboxylesterase
MTPTTLVFLPGLANDGEVFDDVRAELRRAAAPPVASWLAAARVSDVHTRHATLPEMARALLREVPGRLVLVGHSMGGMLAQHAMRQAPARIAGLALLATSARPDTPELIRLRTEACELFAAGRIMEVLQANVAFAFHPDHAEGGMVQRYYAIVQRAGAAQLIAQNRAVMARDDGRSHLAAIDSRHCPTLVLCGEGDLLTPPEVNREIAEAVHGARFELLPRCGHMLTLEQPAAVAAALGRWLAEVAAGPWSTESVDRLAR